MKIEIGYSGNWIFWCGRQMKKKSVLYMLKGRSNQFIKFMSFAFNFESFLKNKCLGRRKRWQFFF